MGNIDGKSLMMGWLVGKRIASMRGGQAISAGLYETGTTNLVYSWDQLLGDEILEGGVVHVTDGEFTTNYSYLRNASAEYLNGDLIMPKDGSITSIGASAFEQCEGLTNVEIPVGVISVGDSAFYGCKGLTHIEVPNGVTSIGYAAFCDCERLVRIFIPESVVTIGYLWNAIGYARGTFADCPNLESILLPAGLTFLSSGIFHNCTGLTSIDIPNGVTVIGVSAFQECAGITSIVIPQGVTEIMRVAFHGCINLSSITFNGTNEQWNAITLGSGWNEYVPATEVICSDGKVNL